MTRPSSILILCTGNSCRSQMAEGWLRRHLGDSYRIESAGIEAHGLNRRAVAAMAEVGIDITTHQSNRIDEFDRERFDYVITVCDNARERCPIFPAETETIHHSFPDPADAEGTEEEIREVFAAVRDQIGEWTESFAERLRRKSSG